MSRKPNATPSFAEQCIDGWIEMYVAGRWTLGEFEAHVEAMLPKFTPQDWLSRRERSGKRPTAKQAAEAWSTAAARHAANYTAGTAEIATMFGANTSLS